MSSPKDDKPAEVPLGAEPAPPTTGRRKVAAALGVVPDRPSYTTRDLYAGQRTDVKPLEPGKAAAAEVSQGAWRERAFAPRGVMGSDEIMKGLTEALDARPPTVSRLLEDWLQFLRQAVEQAGGDCLDAWLSAALKPNDKPLVNPVLVELAAAFDKMRAASSYEEGARDAIAAVTRCLASPARKPCSFKVLERELEGKIDVDGLILFRLSSSDALAARAAEIGQTLERIRDEVKKMPGAKPDGMYSNFARLKAEARLIDGELKRRPRG